MLKFSLAENKRDVCKIILMASKQSNNDILSNNTSVKRQINFPAILLVGILSMFFAEVMAGSSNLWFLDPFAWLISFILYLVHLIFYLNLAVYTNRTSLVHLYLWGILFALYEAPITQVLWSGYTNSIDAPMLLFGIASIEFIVLVFFWHPIMSFIFPILMYESLVFYYAKIEGKLEDNSLHNNFLPGHLLILQKMKSKRIWIFLAFFILSINQITAVGYHILRAEGAYLGTIFLIFIFWKWAVRRSRSRHQPFSIQDLIIRTKSFKWLVIVLMLYVYIFGSWLITKMIPDRWPTNPIGYITIIIYAIFVLLIIKISGKSTKPDEEGIHTVIKKDFASNSIFGVKDLGILFGLVIIGALIFGILGAPTLILSVITYFSFVVVGIVLLIITIKNLVKHRKKSTL